MDDDELDIHAIRRNLASAMNKILSDYGLENAVSGGKYPDLRQEIDPETGYWAERSVISKPPRLIVQFKSLGEVVGARIPEANTNGNFAYANTARRPVGGLVVRVLPVIEFEEEQFMAYPEWEWLLWYCFWPQLRNGSSGQLFDGFNPSSGTFTYMGQVQPYIAAGLVSLNDHEDVVHHPESQHPLFTYWGATEALKALIKVAPSSVAATSVRSGDAKLD